MLIIERNIFRATSLFARRLCSEAFSHTNNEVPAEYKEEHSRAEQCAEEHSPGILQVTKCLNIAMLGSPNAGKSTLVNQLVNRSVCATSSKVHTTLCKARAIDTVNDTQLVFIDTPGIVSPSEIAKYKLQSSFEKDPAKSLQQADVIGIIQDASNKFTNFKINRCLLESLKEVTCEKPIFLVLNKIDLLKKKEILLSLVAQIIRDKDNPKFDEIFMISALTGSGVDDLRNYLLASAKPQKWLFNSSTFTDQAVETMVEQTVRGKCMDLLSNELPYNLKIMIEDVTIDGGNVTAAVRITCPKARYVQMLIGNKGQRIRTVAHESEEILRNAFRSPVCLKIAVVSKKS